MSRSSRTSCAPCAGLCREHGLRPRDGALRVFSNAEGAYGSNVNQLVDIRRLGRRGRTRRGLHPAQVLRLWPRRQARQRSRAAQMLAVELAYQNLESVELGVTTIDHYFDTLGGISRAVKRARGVEACPSTSATRPRGDGKVRTLSGAGRAGDPHAHAQPEMVRGHAEARLRGRAPDRGPCDQHHGLVGDHGPGRALGLQRISETFVLDERCAERLAELNPTASPSWPTG
jgi:magnesium chelatase subunit H